MCPVVHPAPPSPISVGHSSLVAAHCQLRQRRGLSLGQSMDTAEQMKSAGTHPSRSHHFILSPAAMSVRFSNSRVASSICFCSSSSILPSCHAASVYHFNLLLSSVTLMPSTFPAPGQYLSPVANGRNAVRFHTRSLSSTTQGMIRDQHEPSDFLTHPEYCLR